MSTIKDGGSAYPVPGLSDLPNGELIHPWPGMTLRDAAALAVLPAVYATEIAEMSKEMFGQDWRDGVAVEAYAMADAMLRARDQEPQ